MARFSVHLPFLPVDVRHIAATAALVDRIPGCRLWLAQSMAIETHQLLAYCAGLGLRVPVGTSVTLMPLRHPYEAALHARSLALLSGRPVIAGYGPGPADFQRALLGSRYRSPLGAAKEYLTTIRALLAGTAAASGSGSSRPAVTLPQLPHPRVDLGLGVLRPAMARLAGEIADAAITWLCPPHYLRDILIPEIRLAAAAADRPAPRVVSIVQVVPAGPRRDPAQLALSVSGFHLQAPHYVDMLRKAGLRIQPSDPASGARALVESGTVVHGMLPQLISGLDAYRAAGVDEIVLNLTALGQHRGALVALRELQQLMTALGAVPPL